MRKVLFLAPFVVSTALAAPTLAISRNAEAAAPATTAGPSITAGRYALRMHAGTVRGVAIHPKSPIKSFPTVVAAKGGTLAFGGKYGPQLVGTVSGNRVSLHSAPGSFGKGSISLEGTVGASGLSGTYTLVNNNGVTLTGSFDLGASTTSSWAVSGAKVSNSMVGVGGATSGPNMSAGAPGMGNQGPNLGGTSVSGDASSDWSLGGLWNSFTSVGSSGSGSSSSASSAASSSAASSKDDGFFSGIWDEAKAEWNETFGTSTPASTAPTPVGKGNASMPVDDGSNGGGTTGTVGRSGSGIGTGNGQDGSGSRDNGSSGSGGANAAGRTVAVGPNPGDNPFEVSTADVLNANKLFNPASDPILNGVTGMAMIH